MTAKPKPAPKPEIANPRYAGATPDMVGRALLKPVKNVKAKPQKSAASKSRFQSSI